MRRGQGVELGRIHGSQLDICGAGVVRQVPGGDADRTAIDQACRAKYSRYDRSLVEPMVAPEARAATMQLQA